MNSGPSNTNRAAGSGVNNGNSMEHRNFQRGLVLNHQKWSTETPYSIQLNSCIGYLRKLINNNIIVLCNNTKSHHLSIDPNRLSLSNRVPGQLPVQLVVGAKLLRGGVGLVEVLTTRGIALKRQVISTQLRKQLQWGIWGRLIASMQR